MAVPKRKMSRSNTRARRSQWKTTATTLHTCPQVQGEQDAPHGLPVVRHLQGPRRTPRPSAPSSRFAEHVAERGRDAPDDRRTGVSATADQLLEKLGVHLDPELLVLALTHRSFAHEAGGLPTNERLEFLGDTRARPGRHRVAVPDAPRRCSEGSLAKMRAATVSQRALAVVARELDLGSYVLLGKGELSTGGAGQGLDPVRHPRGGVRRGVPVARPRDRPRAGRAPRRARPSWRRPTWAPASTGRRRCRSCPRPWASGRRCTTSTARARTTPGRSPRVRVVDGVPRGVGVGRAKKVAEQDAAADAYRVLEALRSAQD